MNKSWIDKLLEATDEEVTDTITAAIGTQDAMGITDVNKASTEVLPAGASTDPNALVYDKDLYSQPENKGMEDIQVAGTVQNKPVDDAVTSTEVKPDNQTKAATEAAEDVATEAVTLTPDEMRLIYTECVGEFICEHKVELNTMYEAKLARAKEFLSVKKAQKKAEEEKAKKAKAVKESADLNDTIAQVFAQFNK